MRNILPLHIHEVLVTSNADQRQSQYIPPRDSKLTEHHSKSRLHLSCAVKLNYSFLLGLRTRRKSGIVRSEKQGVRSHLLKRVSCTYCDTITYSEH